MSIEHCVGWVHVNYHGGRAEPCVRAADDFLASLSPKTMLRVFVDNRPEPGRGAAHAAQRAGWEYVSGTNVAREFSGWQEGVERVRQLARAETPGFIVFSNDTFLFHQPYRLLLRPMFLRSVRLRIRSGDRAWAIGQTERSPFVPGLPSYFSTALFVVSWEALARIGFAVRDPDVESMLEPPCGARFFSARMDPSYARYLESWLFVPGRKSWYAARPLTVENAAAMHGKATCILNEHSLSRRLRTAGVKTTSCFEQPLLEKPLRVVYRLLQAGLPSFGGRPS